MPLIKRNDSKAVSHILEPKEKKEIKAKWRDGASKEDLLTRARSTFNNDKQDTKRKAAIRMIENLFLKAK